MVRDHCVRVRELRLDLGRSEAVLSEYREIGKRGCGGRLRPARAGANPALPR